MKKKLFLAIVMTVVLTMLFAFAVSADSVHNKNTVDYSETVTLDDGTVCNLFDSNGNALIWYISGTQDGMNIYTSICADDPRVKYEVGSWTVSGRDFNGVDVKGMEAKNFKIIFDDGKELDLNKIVVFNIMDDDVKSNYGVPETSDYYGRPITCVKEFMGGKKNLEYVYLRLDTIAIMRNMFGGCTKLKYINLEDLTNLVEIGDGGNFSGCSSLFHNQILDLSRTQFARFDGGTGALKGVPLKGIKFPDTLVDLGTCTFQDCTNLETVAMTKRGGKVTNVGSNVFEGCTSLKVICYVGTEEDFKTLNINATGNSQFSNEMSYADYKALSSEEKNNNVYAVYDYSKCEAYNDGIHGETTPINVCLGTCVLCGDTVINHTETKNLTATIEYSDYTKAGIKTTFCNNEGCTYSATEDAPALFTCLGYSAFKAKNGGILIGFGVNNKAISDYADVTGKDFSFGLFVGMKSKIDTNEAVSADGEGQSGAIAIDFTERGFDIVELKVIGITTDDHKKTNLVLGLYVIDAESVSYVQVSKPNDGEKYSYVSYNSLING